MLGRRLTCTSALHSGCRRRPTAAGAASLLQQTPDEQQHGDTRKQQQRWQHSSRQEQRRQHSSRQQQQPTTRCQPSLHMQKRHHNQLPGGEGETIVAVMQATTSSGRLVRFSVDSKGGLLQENADSAATTSARLADASHALLSTILPAGYPDSVKPGYGPYTWWQFASMACSSAAGVLSTQALLHAVGLGAGAIPMAAALNWVIKDGLGQLGGVVFSSLVATRFDANPKLWRMVSAIALDASTALELAAPFAAHLFLPIASVANVGKNVSFLAASASRAAIHNAFARRENLADITGKAGSQYIVSSMLGMGAGIGLSAALGSEWAVVAPAAAVLCFGHLASTYQCLRPVVLPTLDEQRLEIVLRRAAAAPAGARAAGVPSPEEVSALETIFAHPLRAYLGRDAAPGLVLGARVADAVRTSSELQSLWDYALAHGDGYMVAVRTTDGGGGSGGGGGGGSGGGGANFKSNLNTGEKRACVYLLLLEGATPETVLRGAQHAHAARDALAANGYGRLEEGGAGGGLALDAAAAARPRDGGAFVAGLREQGWSLDVLFFEHASQARVKIECV